MFSNPHGEKKDIKDRAKKTSGFSVSVKKDGAAQVVLVGLTNSGKSTILNIKMIGTPSIILKLYKEKIIEKDKTINSLNELKKIGWFSNAIIDKILMEVK